MDRIDCVVAGAGVVGLAIARALSQRGREVLVLESASGIGTGTSSRNSEVIHAGIYYAAGSLKARLCVAGREKLYDYCHTHHVPHRRCGKLIVATSQTQVTQLQSIVNRARANGVDDLVLLNREQARQMEPALECVAAIHSPSTGIVDSHALMLALQGDMEKSGAVLALNTSLALVKYKHNAIEMVADDGTALLANTLINAAGLGAQDLAQRIEGLDPQYVPSSYYAKGNYFTLSGRSPFSRLIYPVPEAAGLGVHLTVDLGGQAKFGPDVEWVDSPDDLVVNPTRCDAFYAEVRKYWPQLPDGALQTGYAGIRPKTGGPHEPAGDFLIQGPETHGLQGLVNLFGIESPGLTSSLAIGEYVADLLDAPDLECS